VSGEEAHDLLARVLGPDPGPFALLHRPETTGPGLVDVLVGEVSVVATLADVPVRAGSDVLVLVPYRQIVERGFTAIDDGTPLVAMAVEARQAVRLPEALVRLPSVATPVAGGDFDIDDDQYAAIVRRVVAEEIGSGAGANMVVKRSYFTDIEGYGPDSALALFRRLLERETGSYWTFVIHTGERTLVGASPERHISVDDGLAVMNPISGTYRYPPSGPSLPGVMDFLADRKEADELYMVVDEELKMMARICADGGRVVGPRLKEMARLAHTEYFIEGHTTLDPRDVLRETLLAPTVTGSPLESACRVIAAHETRGRGYYSGVAALIEDGGRALDSAILIRTADISPTGRVRLDVGATLVRHSDPMSEAAETRAKAAGLLAALAHGGSAFATHPSVRAALAGRNDGIADFWQRAAGDRGQPAPELVGKRVLVVDAEDTFTSMIANQLRSLGLLVVVRRFDEPHDFDGYDLVVLGPGPGDPAERGHPRIARLHAAVDSLLARRLPFVAVCLSHQVLALRLGLALRRREEPNQGVQKEIDLFGRLERVGFYNTFAAVCADDEVDVDGIGAVDVSRDPESGEVHALRGPHFASMQFHAESVLTRDGPRLIAAAASGVLHARV
jgi:2-amino-4-deoxychorismate synthase